ncbi:MAG: PAS domain-containing protein [Ignavibacteria bacterium]|nr:PAS domain-containing protein [Ignavibacteria bacterium]
MQQTSDFLIDLDDRLRIKSVETKGKERRLSASALHGRSFREVFRPVTSAAAFDIESILKNGFAGSFLSREIPGNGMFIKIVPKEEGFTAYGFFLTTSENELSDPVLKDLLSAHTDIDFFLWQDSDPMNPNAPVSFNDQVEKITGYTSVELNKMHGRLFSIIHRADVTNVLRVLNEAKNNHAQHKVKLEFRLVTKSEEVIWVSEQRTITRNSKGDPEKVSGIVTDITKLKLKQFNLEESETNLKRLNDSKDRFINILSHDLRGPYTSILGFAEILLNEPDLPEHEKIEYLTYIYEASVSQLQFINYLLDWSRLRTGKLKPESQRLPAHALIHNCVSNLTGNAIRKNIEIVLDVPIDLYVHADERLAGQVISNLLNNAIKFSYENSKVEITAGLFNTRQVEFIVKDHGMGISPDDKAKLFNLDKIVSKEGSKGEKGSGFGLTLVKEIVEKHGGEIWFYSEEDSGSEFHFTLPVPANTIMIVDSEPDEEKSLREMIHTEFKDYELVSVDNGYEAVDLLKESAPALIIAGKNMPLMSCEQFIEAVNPSDSHFKTPVVLLSDDGRVDSDFHSERGVKAILQRPIDKTKLTEAVKSIIN